MLSIDFFYWQCDALLFPEIFLYLTHRAVKSNILIKDHRRLNNIYANDVKLLFDTGTGLVPPVGGGISGR